MTYKQLTEEEFQAALLTSPEKSAAHKKKLAKKKSERDKQKEIAKREALIEEKSKLLKNEKAKVKRVKDIITGEVESGLLTGEEISEYKLEEAVIENNVVWKPHPGVQTDFLASPEDEVLFAGGRGSGKSDCMMIDPLRWCNNKNFRGLVLRRTMPELRELISRAKELYPLAYPGTRWKEQEKMFVFPSGAKMEFGYCESIDDIERYKGQQYTWVGIDEITQFKDEMIIDKLKGSMRTIDPNLPVQLRATTNPNGAGRGWVKRRWRIDETKSGETSSEEFEVLGRKIAITRKWFNSTVKDNPTLIDNNPQYLASLASISNEVLRKQWLDGDWSAAEGLAFSEFNPDIHVIQPFAIPHNWFRFRAMDWGYSSMACCLWLAVDHEGTIYVYRELVTKELTVDKVADKIIDSERRDGEFVTQGYLDSSVWSKRGEIGETPAETMTRMGLRWIPSDRSPGSRIASKLLIHQYLQIDEKTKKPGLIIFSNCREIISELENLPLDENNPEDVDTDCVDHAYDALRYGIQSRPKKKGGWADYFVKNRNDDNKPIAVNSVTGM